MKPYFPFVTIPENSSMAAISADHPFLFLSILAVASSRKPRLHQRINYKFCRVPSDRLIVHGEKNLDYLKGLLVYIAW